MRQIVSTCPSAQYYHSIHGWVIKRSQTYWFGRYNSMLLFFMSTLIHITQSDFSFLFLMIFCVAEEYMISLGNLR